MSLGRRKARVDDPAAWVFNRMADVYDARPPYPTALVDALATLAPGARVGDLGAGTGHLALPLAARGLTVTAVEPAEAMLTRLRESAARLRLSVRALHAAAEALPVEDASFDLVVVADALHFLDPARAADEVARVLAPQGALALVTSTPADTPFMSALVRIMEESAPRRPRDLRHATVQLFATSGVRAIRERRFPDATAVDANTLERILRSISFIGPAMNAARFEAFRRRVHALTDQPRWARTLTLRTGLRGARG